MFAIATDKRETIFDSGCSDDRVACPQPGRYCVLFDVNQGTMADCFGQGKNSEIQVTQKILAESLLLLVLGALQQLKRREYGKKSPRRTVD
jgi:hypothetical protein